MANTATGFRAALRQRLRMLGWTFPLLGLTAAGFGLLIVTLQAVPYALFWVGIPLTVGAVWLTRLVADAFRWISASALDVPIRRPYRPWPKGHLGRKFVGVLGEAATWRDLAWLALNSVLGFAVFLVVLSLFASFLQYTTLPLQYAVVRPGERGVPEDVLRTDFGIWAIESQSSSWVAVPIGLGFLGLWWWLMPLMLRGYARLSGTLLGPTGTETLAARVQQLTESRAETVDAQAAELRRIERDLHDGAQARLVSLGMSLGMAEELVRTDPDAAARLLAEAREDSGQALSELRQLVRGMHPPVLADRGLSGAVQALALAHPLPVEVVDELPGRLPAPVESAAYFAVAEVLTNVSKHARATWAEVRLDHQDGRLMVTVSDNGRGGAVAAGGGGLHGVTRRLLAFDGTVDITSPSGGPTVVILEIPCDPVSTAPRSGTAGS
jgi:signal transduction histidine kinase